MCYIAVDEHRVYMYALKEYLELDNKCSTRKISLENYHIYNIILYYLELAIDNFLNHVYMSFCCCIYFLLYTVS